jgi:hypothetical protein
MAEGDNVTLRANVVSPLYTDDGFLAPCFYRAILTVLIERHRVRTGYAASRLVSHTVCPAAEHGGVISMCMPQARRLLMLTVHCCAVCHTEYRVRGSCVGHAA